MLRYVHFRLFIFWLAVLLGACQTGPGDSVLISIGSSQAEVKAQLGEPERVQEFELPDPPFFGPQEILTDLIPAGTKVEEWVYLEDEEELYIWFVGAEGEKKDHWKVIETGRFPAGAIY